MSALHLYELTDAYTRLQALLVDAEEAGDEEAGAVIARCLSATGDQLADKAEAVAAVIRSLEAEAEAYGAELERLKRRRDARANAAARLKGYLKGQLEAAGIERVAGQRFTVALQNSPPSVAVADDQAAIDAGYGRVTVTVDKAALLARWKADPASVEGLAVVTQGKHLRIR